MGFSIDNFPFIDWKKEVTIAEVANIALTIGLAVWIPYAINSKLDKHKDQKNEVVDDCKNTLSSIRQIKEKLSACYSAGVISPLDKDAVNLLFEDADNKLYNLDVYLEQLFGSNHGLYYNEIQNCYNNYWNFVTDSPLMGSNYTQIDLDFNMKQIQLFNNLEQAFRKAIMRIHAS